MKEKLNHLVDQALHSLFGLGMLLFLSVVVLRYLFILLVIPL